MKLIQTLFAVLLLLSGGLLKADAGLLKVFETGSYRQILSANTGKGFVLVLWSVDCTTCIRDLGSLSSLHKNRPELKIVMISIGEPSLKDEIKAQLQNSRLEDVDNWLFVDNNLKLLNEIDPVWLDELPRTYFFSASHERDGVSGELKTEDYIARLGKMKF